MAPAALIAGVVWCATALLLYAGVSALEWIVQLRRTEQGGRVATVVDLVGALVPMVIGYIVVVFASVVFGFRSGVVVLAVVVPAGLAWALRSQITEREPKMSEPVRIGAALALTVMLRTLEAV